MKFATVIIICLFAFVKSASAQVLINEIQASNISTTTDQFGEYDDWIELYNAGNTNVNLNGYGLTDNISLPFQFQFPDISLAPQSYLLVFAADTTVTDVMSHWETAINSNDTWYYRANTSTPPDTNWRNLSFTGNWSTGPGGIGFGDSDDGTTVSTCVSIYMRKTFTLSDKSKIRAAVLNIDFDDCFVAYINGKEIARMNIGTKGVRPAWNTLALSSHEAQMYQGGDPDSIYLDEQFLNSVLVNGTNVLSVEAHNQSTTNSDITCRPWLSFLIDNEVSYFGPVPSFFNSSSKQYLHANFKLSRSGETLYLVNPSGVVMDQKNPGTLEPDNSLGRNPDGSNNWCLFASSSPGLTNNSSNCANSYASTPVFSLTGGFYPGRQNLSLSTSYPGGQIRYTIDGSDVNSNSTLYTNAIEIDTTVTVRAAVFATSALPSPVITNTYFISVKTKLPVFSLTTDPDNLWDYNTGIFEKGPNAGTSNPYWGANFWEDWEKPITLEYYDRSKNRAFRFNSGMKITGGWSRSAPQKSLEIMLGDRYGQSSLNYPLEESVKPWLTNWDDFILHNTGNDRNLCKMRDPLMNRLLKGTHNDYLAYEPCMVFINGQNWGVYYIRENDDHHWIESNYGFKKDEVDLLKESYFYSGIEVKKGSDSAFFEMYEYAMNTSPSDQNYYSTMSSFMDLENMVDYFIAETYYPNDDWMGGSNNNLKLWRPRTADGKFRYLIYDLDFGFGYSGTVSNNMLSVARNASPHNYNSDLFKVLTNNTTYKRYFINRYADLINTIFLPSNVEAMVDLFADSIKHDMHFQWEAWGGDSANWVSKINSMMTFVQQRPAYARNFVQSEFGLNGQVTLTIQAQPAGAGRIQISTVTPTSLPWTGVYFNGNPVTITAIPNPGYTFSHWRSSVVINQNNTNQSATINFTSNDVITCHFTGTSSPLSIAFSEINYNSQDTLDAGDWIELKNSANYNLDISGWKFRDDEEHHTYEFPAGTRIPAGGYLVVASDLNKFNSRFPSVNNVTGDFGFDFSNGGENLRLFNHKDSLVKSVYYQDQLPWPTSADGQGYTLESSNISGNANDGANWFPGCLEGSPGTSYAGPQVSVSASGSLSVCQGQTIDLQANTDPGFVYQWKRNSQNISQAVQNNYTVSTSGLYQVMVSGNGCSALSDTFDVTVNPYQQVTTVNSAFRCGAGTTELSASGTSLLKWYENANGGIEVGTGNTFTTPVLSQSTSFYVSASGDCPSARMQVDAIIQMSNSSPQAQDGERCGPGDISLIATDTAAIRWYDSATGGNLIGSGSILYIPSLLQSQVYYAEAGLICPSTRVAVQATLIPVTESPITNDVSHCGPGAIVLQAASANQLNWYNAPSGGNLLANGNSYTTPVINQTASYFVEAGDVCPSLRVEVQAIIESISPDPIVSDVHHCGSGTIVLNATASDPLTWYDTQNGIVLGSGSQFQTPFLNQTTQYFVRAGVNCPSGWVAVLAILDPISADPIVTDASVCGEGSIVLNAQSLDPIRWYDNQGGNLVGTGSSFTTPVLLSNSIFYAVAGAICPSNFVAVNATVHQLPTPDLGNDTMILSGAQLILDPGQSFVAYDWSDGSTASTLNVQAAGLYSVHVTDANGCSASD
ncbi:MAG: CotH kinase family protein, partial [Bacteroidia bacterium]|nr:CotH kinase family protein [Bacteroidia bacterium]